MAESTLSIAYEDLQLEVARYAAWTTTLADWTAENTADFTRILKGGLRKFYFPVDVEPGIPMHEWSFLRTYTTQVLSSGDYDYDLPDNCSGQVLDDSVTYAASTGVGPLVKVDEAVIRELRALHPVSGSPRYYAVRTKTHAPTTGNRYELLVYPTPDDTKTLTYAYVFNPEVIDGTNKYPHGGARYSQCILEAVLSEAERLLDDEPNGEHHKKFLQLLSSAVRADKEIKFAPELTGGVT